MMANATFVFGLMHYYGQQKLPPEQMMSFAKVKENFVQAYRKGLNATFTWQNNNKIAATDLLLKLLPKAKYGLDMLNINPDDSDYFLNIIEQRIMNRQNGSDWQLKFIKKHPGQFKQLIKQYLELQNEENPVHTWPI